MAFGDFEIGRKYHCRDEASGLTGTFQVGKELIEVELFSYDKFFHLDASKHLVVRTEVNHIVSLHDNVPGGTGQVNTKPLPTAYHARTISNIAVIGQSPWQPDDLVRQVRFQIPHSNDTLQHIPTFEAVVGTKLGQNVNNEVFTVPAIHGTVGVSYSYSGNMDFDYPLTVDPILTIEFNAPKTLYRYRDRVQEVVRFFAAVVGTFLNTTGIEISQLTEKEQRDQIEQGSSPARHRIYEILNHHEPRREGASIWAGHQFAHTRTDVELSAFIACLVAWINREPQWVGATVLMMECMALNRVMSANRLLSACKWFEEIPGTKSIPAIKPADIDIIAAHASQKGADLGYADLAIRIAGAIKPLSRETRVQQLERVVASIKKVFGDGCLGQDILLFLTKAYAFRGRVAHGHLSFENDREYSEFSKSVHAMECVCYLLTIKDLPMLDEGKKRVLGNPMVSDYKHSYLAPGK